MEKYSKQDISEMLISKGQISMLNIPDQCQHENIVKSYRNGIPYQYVCTDCGLPSKNRGAFFKYQESCRVIH